MAPRTGIKPCPGVSRCLLGQNEMPENRCNHRCGGEGGDDDGNRCLEGGKVERHRIDQIGKHDNERRFAGQTLRLRKDPPALEEHPQNTEAATDQNASPEG